MQVNILDAKNRLSQLIKVAMSGEEVVIANRGKPVVRLVPAETAHSMPQQGSAERILGWLKTHPPQAQRSDEEIDADIEAERRSWD